MASFFYDEPSWDFISKAHTSPMADVNEALSRDCITKIKINF